MVITERKRAFGMVSWEIRGRPMYGAMKHRMHYPNHALSLGVCDRRDCGRSEGPDSLSFCSKVADYGSRKGFPMRILTRCGLQA